MTDEDVTRGDLRTAPARRTRRHRRLSKGHRTGDARRHRGPCGAIRRHPPWASVLPIDDERACDSRTRLFVR